MSLGPVLHLPLPIIALLLLICTININNQIYWNLLEDNFLQYAVTFKSFFFFNLFNVFLRGYLIPTFYSETVDFKVLLPVDIYLYPCLMNVIVLSVGTCLPHLLIIPWSGGCCCSSHHYLREES